MNTVVKPVPVDGTNFTITDIAVLGCTGRVYSGNIRLRDGDGQEESLAFKASYRGPDRYDVQGPGARLPGSDQRADPEIRGFVLKDTGDVLIKSTIGKMVDAFRRNGDEKRGANGNGNGAGHSPAPQVPHAANGNGSSLPREAPKPKSSHPKENPDLSKEKDGKKSVPASALPTFQPGCFPADWSKHEKEAVKAAHDLGRRLVTLPGMETFLAKHSPDAIKLLHSSKPTDPEGVADLVWTTATLLIGVGEALEEALLAKRDQK